MYHFFILPKRGGPNTQLFDRFHHVFFFGRSQAYNNPHPTCTLCAKTFAEKYANKRHRAIDNVGLFVKLLITGDFCVTAG